MRRWYLGACWNSKELGVSPTEGGYVQVVFGCVLPVTVGPWRELASRRASAHQARLRTCRVRISQVVMQLFAVNAHVLTAVALLSILFSLIPPLEHLPTVLRGDQASA